MRLCLHGEAVPKDLLFPRYPYSGPAWRLMLGVTDRNPNSGAPVGLRPAAVAGTRILVYFLG